MATSRYSFDLFIRRQVELEGLKSAYIDDFDNFVQRIDDLIRNALAAAAVDKVNQLTQVAYENLVQAIKSILDEQLTGYTDELEKHLEALAEDESRFTVAAFEAALADGTDIHSPELGVPWRFASNSPVQAGGLLLGDYIAAWVAQEVAAFEGVIRNSYAQGWTVQQVITFARGTRARNYTDGMLGKLQRDLATMVRTSVQHVSNSSRASVYEANSALVSGYRWVSVLDLKTTPVCRSLDGQVFDLGNGPLPPAHPNCRSTTIPEFVDGTKFREGDTRPTMTGLVSSDMTYYDWLLEQPAAFQDAVLGPTRGKLLRNGGLSAEEFARLNLGRTFKPLTLDQMRQRWPQVFEQAGL
jgi:SPP1 gp7 family putative phage head morphogenesis protein